MAQEVKEYDDLDAAGEDAAGALDRETRPSLFDRLSWFRLIQAYCPPSGRPLILRARDGEARAWLFLSRRGRHAEALASWYTLRYGAIVDGEAPSLPAALAGALRERVATADLYPLAEGDGLAESFRRAGWLTIVEPAGTSWRIATYGMTFAAYWAGRPSRLRNTGERKAKAAKLDVAVHTVFDEAAWADYEKVYRASWKPEEGSAAFLRALAEQEGEAGTLRLSIASKDGEPLAAQLWLIENGTATIHKLAYVAEAKAMSPGTVLSMAMFRHALDVDHVRLIDFGLGDDGYKAEWMEEKRPVLRLRAFNPATMSGLYLFARAKASALVRRRRTD
ncbi:GNAT family N-acetyltransferase [Enterovirga sp. GCM10030262]|uniref:GNAT family N-acetyltransferase n=1 Tax=Enterovirga sp. GCM10030262 TaxID=3273391 RepID=UPI003622A3D8